MNKQEREFQAFVLDWYKVNGRHALPWRQTTDPYKVLVSELMLQQTQVARVIPKYEVFIQTYPTVQLLAAASLGDVLRLWQGLGYNRRAKYLHTCAQTVVSDYGGVFPVTEVDLRKLPGIGPYTAAAICAFAYNQPVELVETNVRQVMIHHFFKVQAEVTDAEILQKVSRTLPQDNARTWYAALMDYGTHLKAQHGNNTKKVKGYTKQSKFKGSDREVRGAILRALAETRGAKSLDQLAADLAPLPPHKIKTQSQALLDDELLVKQAGKYQLP